MTTSAPTRAVIYARFSSDLQSAASIPDQIRLCRRLCEDNGWTVVEVFYDEAMSGATHLRRDFQRMQQLALQGGPDILVAEGLDRISRDQEHIAGLYKRLLYLDVRIVTKAEGEVSELHIGLGGTMSALFLKQLAQKTHRGLEGRVKAGKSAGGISFGYKMDRKPLLDGSYTTGDRLIDPVEAAIVRRIFQDYDCGKSARTIAADLNREGICSPRSQESGVPGVWSFSTISGNWKRGTGILNNELYIGTLIWNRQRFVKDPDTGKRQARPNPPEAWLTEDVPDLRIIDDAQWQRVKLRQGAVRQDIIAARHDGTSAPKAELGRRARYLFSGSLECGCCGSNYIMISDSRYGCAAARNSGTCTNRKTIKRSDVEARVLAGLKEQLLHPDLIAEFIAEFHRESQSEHRASLASRIDAEQRLSKVNQQIDAIVSAIAEGMYHASMKVKMDALEAERASLSAVLHALPCPEPVPIHPGIVNIYARKVADLAASLNEESTKAEAADILRSLIVKIILRPDPDAANCHVIELYGELAAILSLCGNGMGTNAKTHANGVGNKQVTMVAGTGFEPVTFRL
jgi:site-specific DNA recombinase